MVADQAMVKLAVVVLMATEMAAINMVFPFCLAMVRNFGIGLEWEGFCAGLLAAAYSLGQCLSGKMWGKISDRVGRTPTIVTGLAAAACCMVSLGLAQTYTAAFISRLSGGIFNGFTGIIKALVSELTSEDGDERARFFLLIQIGSSCGAIAGPLLGGMLVGDETDSMPYLPPCLACALLQVTACFLGGYALPWGGLKPTKIETAVVLNPAHALGSISLRHHGDQQRGVAPEPTVHELTGSYFMLLQADYKVRNPGVSITPKVLGTLKMEAAMRANSYVYGDNEPPSPPRLEQEAKRQERRVYNCDLHLLQPENTTVNKTTLDDSAALILGAYVRDHLHGDAHDLEEAAAAAEASQPTTRRLSDIFSACADKAVAAAPSDERTQLRQQLDLASGCLPTTRTTYGTVSPLLAEAVGDETAGAEKEKKEKKPLLTSPPFLVASVVNAFSALLDELSSVSTALLLGWPLAAGGAGMDSASLGFTLGLAGLGMLSIVLVGLPPLQRRYTPLRLFRYVSASLALSMVALPFACKAIATSPSSAPALSLLLLVPLVALSNGSCAGALVCANIFVQDAIADKARLGEGNGVAQALISLGRILGPTLAGAFFSFGEAVGDVAAAFVVVALLCAGAGLSSVLVSRPGLEAA